ncbi:ABC transporter substrate-binding protein [Piscinibacter sp.]|uniref:ABC transporter substrate-binding protein n=1 Tax=Piscinibacter sp. TaxID=1903157 RepID=UPI001B79D741|nr:ABC transporter substrate-binding protein [Piscinibacter sp.]MBK7533299.1 bicyclomycin resistance protein [Piscinibacter sp.]MBP6544240.1 bicyclomycin resistance protein [Piscinibacter sp.]
MSLRGLTRALLLALACGAAHAQPAAADAPRVLRYAFPVAETGFDPAQISDLYSRTVIAGIIEAPLVFDFLARPFKMKPNTLVAMPQISEDFRTFTFQLKPGIFFADDPAFKGARRELVAQDYVYSLKRHYDPRWNSPNLYRLEAVKILGLSELRQQVLKDKQPFPYDREVEGLRALDRYTFQVKLAEPAPRFHQEVLTDAANFGALAREVVEFYGDKIMEHPVGTGPFVLAEWRRSSRIVLARNPNYREVLYDEEAPADDPRSQAIAAQLKGRRLPMLDRVEIAIIEEAQPRWLSFLNGQTDLMERLPNEFAPVAAPNDKLAPNLAKRGITMDRSPLVDITLAALFNQDNPVVGGYTPQKVALRRAIALAYDSDKEIRLVRKSQAVPAQTAIAPLTFGYNPALKTTMSDHDPARARALLDMYGYLDRDGDGWRELPDGKPLLLEYATQPDQSSRQLAELWEKSMKAVGLRIVFKVAKWPENLKASRTGKLMMWGVAWSASTPDGETFLALAYGPNKGGANHARFDLPAFNTLFARQGTLPDGPERAQVMEEASKLMVAYVPYKLSTHRIVTDLMQPWVIGFRRNPFMREFYKYLDVDPAIREREAK